MPSCDYCDRRFDDEDAYLDHLESAHYDDLDRIDRRRVDAAGEGSGRSTVLLAGVAVVGLLVVAVAAYAVFSLGGDGGDGGTAELPAVENRPSGLGQVHAHGTITVQIEDRVFDFSREEFQLRSDYFHFEGGTGERFHVHARGVTLQFALSTLDIGVTEDRVVWQGTAYERSDPGTDVTIAVNGQSVDPATYVLQEGDDVVVRVET